MSTQKNTYGTYSSNRLPRQRRTISVPGSLEDTNKYFRCWNCGSICDVEREILTQGGLQTSSVASLSNISLLLHMNGTNGSSTFTDSSPILAHTVTATGATISTGQYKFGDSSGYFDGASYLTIPDNADFDLSGGYWTIDFWIRLTTSGPIYFQKTDNSNYFYLRTATSGGKYRVMLSIYASGSEVVSVATDYGCLTASTWSHVEVSEYLNNYRIYVDGNLWALTYDTSRPANYTGSVTIGTASGITEAIPTLYLDEFRVSKSVKHLDRSFPVPDAEYDTDSNELDQKHEHWENSAYYPYVVTGCWFCGANYK